MTKRHKLRVLVDGKWFYLIFESLMDQVRFESGVKANRSELTTVLQRQFMSVPERFIQIKPSSVSVLINE